MIKRSLEALLMGHPGRYLEEGAPVPRGVPAEGGRSPVLHGDRLQPRRKTGSSNDGFILV